MNNRTPRTSRNRGDSSASKRMFVSMLTGRLSRYARGRGCSWIFRIQNVIALPCPFPHHHAPAGRVLKQVREPHALPQENVIDAVLVHQFERIAEVHDSSLDRKSTRL